MEQDKSRVKMKLYNIMLDMRGNQGAINKIYWAMEDMGIRIAISRFFNWKNGLQRVMNPTPQMIASRKYFAEHRDEIQDVLELLEDEVSRETYLKIIKYRQTAKHKDLPENSYARQYFGNDYFEYCNGEIFIDCGAFDGDSVRKFKKLMKKKNVKSYKCVCFEPDERNFAALRQNHQDAVCYKAGVWNKAGELFFRIGHGDDNNIVSENDRDKYLENEIITIPVQSIDETKECSNATYIKMDIEGAEQMAILGAKNTILSNKPKLGISIYHSDEDMIKIPLMIHELVPEYKLYIKHHSNGVSETVLYATV